jgi:1-aminocyclopropane-1-carboxylate deaminase/D-cysteine desulfhydrase-like pyridoxal-dependent ACC family enzyme
VIENQGPESTRAAMAALAEELRAEGRKPRVIPVGGSTSVGAAGYAAMVDELLRQLEERDLSATHLYLVAGSGGTQAGILAGVIATGAPLAVQGISVAHDSDRLEPAIADLAGQTLQYLGLGGEIQPDQVHVDDRYVGPSYGVVTPGMLEALEILARDEGVLLDPVYTGKAMAGLIDHARQGRLSGDNTVIFLHSGGVPALFAYHHELDQAVSQV